MVYCFRNVKELYTLVGISKKQGRFPLEKDLGVIKNAALLVKDSKILWVGKESRLDSQIKLIKKTKNLQKSSSKSKSTKSNNTKKQKLKIKEIDLGGRTVLPAFVECHSHSVFTGNRADEFELRNQGVSYQEISKKGGGILSTVKGIKKSSDQELQDNFNNIATQFNKQGVTSLETKSGYGLNFKFEKKMFEAMTTKNTSKNMRIIKTYLGPHAVSPYFKNKQDYLKQIIEIDLPKIKKYNLASRVDIFIEKGFFSLVDAKKYFSKAQELGLDICVHADQLTRTGATSLAIDYSAISADHCVNLSSADIKKLSKSNTTAVLLPTADFYMKINYPEARKMIDGGARVALATDYNPGTSPSQSLSFVGLLARLEMKMTLAEVLAGYTYNAASALGLQNHIGSLEAGKYADFIVMDNDWKSRLFYQPNCFMPEYVYKGGLIVS